MQTKSNLVEIQAKIGKINEQFWSLGKTMNDKTGLMKPQVWLPDEIKQMLMEQYRLSENEEQNNIALVKYFNPDGGGTWWFSEYDKEGGRFFGLCKNPDYELGYSSNMEMRSVRSKQLKIPLERDLYFVPTPLSEVKRQ